MKSSHKTFAIGGLIMSLVLLSACSKVTEPIVTDKQADLEVIDSQTVESTTFEPVKVATSVKQEEKTNETAVTDDISVSGSSDDISEDEHVASEKDDTDHDEPEPQARDSKMPQFSSGKKVSETHERLIRENEILEEKRLKFEEEIKKLAKTTPKEALEALTNHPSRSEVDFTQEDWLWPVPGTSYISYPFGKRDHPVFNTPDFHNGIDIANPEGTPIVAAKSGLVIASHEDKETLGKYVMILHLDGYYSLYAHNLSLVVEKGQFVNIGEVIAYMGSTGLSSGSHLHFSILKNGRFLNPQDFVSFSE